MGISMRRWIGAVGLCFLAACGATNASGPSFDAVAMSPPSNAAEVYVFRDRVAYAMQAPHVVRVEVAIDGRFIGGLANGGFLMVAVSPGRHVMTVGPAGDMTGGYFVVPAGSVAFLEVSDKTRMEGARAATAGAAAGVLGERSLVLSLACRH